MEDEPNSTCEQCGDGFFHGSTDALARFDFCSAKCEDAYWVEHPKRKAAMDASVTRSS